MAAFASSRPVATPSCGPGLEPTGHQHQERPPAFDLAGVEQASLSRPVASLPHHLRRGISRRSTNPERQAQPPLNYFLPHESDYTLDRSEVGSSFSASTSQGPQGFQRAVPRSPVDPNPPSPYVLEQQRSLLVAQQRQHSAGRHVVSASVGLSGGPPAFGQASFNSATASSAGNNVPSWPATNQLDDAPVSSSQALGGAFDSDMVITPRAEVQGNGRAGTHQKHLSEGTGLGTLSLSDGAGLPATGGGLDSAMVAPAGIAGQVPGGPASDSNNIATIGQIGQLLDHVVTLANNARDLFKRGEHGSSSVCLGDLQRSLGHIGELGSRSLATVQADLAATNLNNASPQGQGHLSYPSLAIDTSPMGRKVRQIELVVFFPCA